MDLSINVYEIETDIRFLMTSFDVVVEKPQIHLLLHSGILDRYHPYQTPSFHFIITT